MFKEKLIKSVVFFIATLLGNFTFANPEGGVVTNGSATITQTPNTTNITQTTDRAIIEWQSFNIGPQEKTTFVQPNSNSITLNRINPNQGASQIFGQLSANGKIILVNQAGIFFGSGSKVDVSGIIASTSNISNANFLAGKYIFDEPSLLGGSIINAGTIIAANHGLVALLGSTVRNDGLIQARLGNVILGSGNKFTIDFAGDQLINFTVDEAPTSREMERIKNSGVIMADGGSILIKAKAAEEVMDNIINMEGVAVARSVDEKDGVIILEGEDSSIILSGLLNASGLNPDEQGGSIKVLAEEIRINEPTVISVSGDVGGGEILIGGNFQGKGPEWNAKNVYVEKNVSLQADAITQGNGGKVIIWSDGITGFHGTISAKGGYLSGDGGFVETSGKWVGLGGATLNLSATNGKTGTWLIDPTDVTISSAATSNESFSSPDYTPSTDTANINVSELVTNLGTSNVTVLTSSGGAGSGDITVSDPITWTSSNTLTLNAIRNIYLNADITATNGGLTLIARSAATDSQSITSGSFASPSSTGVTANINVANFNLSQGGWYQVNASLPTFNITNNFVINSGTLPVATARFLRAAGGTGSTGTPYQLTDIFGLQGIASNLTMLGYSYQLNNNINASVTSNWNSGVGYIPAGNFSNNYTGQFNGQNYTISNLYINYTNLAGIFGFTTNTISNLGVINPNITTTSHAGAITGWAQGTISNVFVLGGSIQGSSTGGVAGIFSGTLNNAFTDIAVSSPSYEAGGLVGSNMGTINNSLAVGYVSGSVDGGIAGNSSSGQVNNTFWDTDKTGQATAANGSVGSSTNLLGGCFSGTCSNGGTVNLSQENTFSSTGWNFTSIWGIIENQSYPYLSSFYSSTPRAISGTSNLSGNVLITLAANGSLITTNNLALGSTRTGNNGFYYFLEGNGTLATNDALLLYATGTSANAITLTPTSEGSITGLTLATNTVNLGDNNTNTISNNTLSTAKGGLVDSNILYSLSGSHLTLSNNISLTSTANSTYSVVGNTTASGTGNITISGATSLSSPGVLTAAGISLQGVSLGSNLLTIANSSSSSIAGAITGTGGITKQGTGTLTLSNSNSYSGATTISQGTLSLSNIGALGSTSGTTVASGSTLNLAFSSSTLTNTNTITLNGTGVGGAGAITMSGTSARINNPLSLASTTLVGGTGSGTLTLGGAITGAGVDFNVNLSNAGISFPTTTLSGGGNLSVTTNGNVTQTGVLTVTGTSGFSLGTGLMTLNQTNDFTGAVSLTSTNASQHQLRDGNAIVLGAWSIAENAAVFASGDITQTGAFTTSSVVAATTTFNAGSTHNVTLTNPSNNFARVSSTSVNDLTLVDTNSLSLSQLVVSGNLNVTTNGDITTGQIHSVAGTATFAAGTGNITLDIFDHSYNEFSVTSANNVTLTELNDITLGLFNITGNLNLTLGGSVSQNAALTISGTPTFTFTSPSSDLLLGTQANSFGAGPSITNNSNVRNVSIRNVSASAAAPTLPSNINNLTIQYDNNSIALPGTTVAGALTITAGGNISQSGALTVTGTPTLTVTALNSDILLGSYANSFSINPIFTDNGNIRDISLRNSSVSALFPTLPSNFRNLSLQFDNANIILPSDVTTIGTQTYASAVVLNTTTTLNTTNSDVLFSSSLDSEDSTPRSITINAGSGNITLDDVGTLFSLDSLDLNSTTNTTLNGSVQANSITTNSGGTTIFNASSIIATSQIYNDSAQINVSSLTLTNDFLTMNDINGGSNGLEIDSSFSGSLNGDISNLNSLTFSGAGEVSVLGANTYDGITYINAGTLDISSNNALGSTVGRTEVASGATLQLHQVDVGSESLILNGGTIAVRRPSSYAGNITVNNDSFLSTPFISSDTLTLSGQITGTGGLELLNGGNFVFSNATNNYSGATTITSGTLYDDVDGALSPNSAIILANDNTAALNLSFNQTIPELSGGGVLGGYVQLNGGNTLTINSSGTTTFSGEISGTGDLTKSGSGSLTLAGVNIYDGTTTLNGGTLIVNNSSALGTTLGDTILTSGSLIINNVSVGSEGLTLNGGTLQGNGSSSYAGNIILGNNAAVSTNSVSDSFTLSGSIDGANTLTLSGPGTLVFNGAVGSSTPLAGLISNSTGTLIGANITTTGNQTYSSVITLTSSPTFTTTSGIINFSGGITGGGNNLTLSGSASAQFIIVGTLASLGNININGSGNNTLQLSTSDSQQWSLTSANTGAISNISGVGGSFNFSNINNLVGGTGANTFTFSNGASLAGTLSGGGTGGSGTLNYSAYTTPINLELSSTDHQGSVKNNSSVTITTFSDIGTVIGTNNSTITLPNKSNTITITGGGIGFINDPINFSSFVNFIAQAGGTQLIFNTPYTVDGSGNVYVNGVLMSFTNIAIPVPSNNSIPSNEVINNAVISGVAFVYSPQVVFSNTYATPTSSTSSSSSSNSGSTSTSSSTDTQSSSSDSSSSDGSSDSSSDSSDVPADAPSFSAVSPVVNSNVDTLLQQQSQIDIQQQQNQSFGCM